MSAVVRVSSSELKKLNITGLNYYNGSQFNTVGLGLVEYREINGGQVVNMHLSDFELQGGVNNYLYVEIEHDEVLPRDVWTFVSLFHPSKAQVTFFSSVRHMKTERHTRTNSLLLERFCSQIRQNHQRTDHS